MVTFICGLVLFLVSDASISHPVFLDWLQSLKQFFINVSYHILVASLTLMALFYLKTIFHVCVISYTCSQSNSDGSVLKQFFINVSYILVTSLTLMVLF